MKVTDPKPSNSFDGWVFIPICEPELPTTWLADALNTNNGETNKRKRTPPKLFMRSGYYEMAHMPPEYCIHDTYIYYLRGVASLRYQAALKFPGYAYASDLDGDQRGCCISLGVEGHHWIVAWAHSRARERGIDISVTSLSKEEGERKNARRVWRRGLLSVTMRRELSWATKKVKNGSIEWREMETHMANIAYQAVKKR